MLKTLYHRIIDYITNKKHAFVIKSSNLVSNDDIIKTVTPASNVDVDVYSDCKTLFDMLNNHKDYYQMGYVEKNDKKNTSNIFINMVGLSNPKIKMYSYSTKNLSKSKL